jgi:hypothetical protein
MRASLNISSARSPTHCINARVSAYLLHSTTVVQSWEVSLAATPGSHLLALVTSAQTRINIHDTPRLGRLKYRNIPALYTCTYLCPCVRVYDLLQRFRTSNTLLRRPRQLHAVFTAQRPPRILGLTTHHIQRVRDLWCLIISARTASHFTYQGRV